ncbi:MAG: MerR family transcriptional regulator [Pseudomonadota bacterium]
MGDEVLTLSQAAARLGVSTKALRLYETRGLLRPARSPAGWRRYGRADLDRARQIVDLRALGFPLREVGALLDAAPAALDEALARRGAAIRNELSQAAARLAAIERRRRALAVAPPPAVASPRATFALPWPWGGEPFTFERHAGVTLLVGPLFSGKTRLAVRLAETLPNATFVGLERAGFADRAGDDGAALTPRAAAARDFLCARGGADTPALRALVAAMEADAWETVVIDLVEAGLDARTQTALGDWLRAPRGAGPALIVMTRSSAVLDLARLSHARAVVLCPANHAPPTFVESTPGAPGFEAVASCLAPPEVRARVAGVVAVRRPAA